MSSDPASTADQPAPTGAKTPETETDGARSRGRRKVEIGVVTSDSMNKTRRVEVRRLVPHEKYGKFLKRRTVCYMHDEQNQTMEGDTVEMMETRPLSKTKRWRLLRIVRPGSKRILAEEAAAMREQDDSNDAAAPASPDAESTAAE